MARLASCSPTTSSVNSLASPQESQIVKTADAATGMGMGAGDKGIHAFDLVCLTVGDQPFQGTIDGRRRRNSGRAHGVDQFVRGNRSARLLQRIEHEGRGSGPGGRFVI